MKEFEQIGPSIGSIPPGTTPVPVVDRLCGLHALSQLGSFNCLAAPANCMILKEIISSNTSLKQSISSHFEVPGHYMDLTGDDEGLLPMTRLRAQTSFRFANNSNPRILLSSFGVQMPDPWNEGISTDAIHKICAALNGTVDDSAGPFVGLLEMDGAINHVQRIVDAMDRNDPQVNSCLIYLLGSPAFPMPHSGKFVALQKLGPRNLSWYDPDIPGGPIFGDSDTITSLLTPHHSLFTFGIGVVFAFRFPVGDDDRLRCSQECYANFDSRLYRILRKFGLHGIMSQEKAASREQRLLSENDLLIERMLG